LEETIAERGTEAIASGVPQKLAFDTRPLLGCDGMVEVLVERLSTSDLDADLLGYVGRKMTARQPCLVATVFATGADSPPLGSYWREADLESSFPWEARQDVREALESGQSHVATYAWGECYFDIITPPIRLVIVGTGHDVPPLESLGRTLGWDVAVISHPAERQSDPSDALNAVTIAGPADLAAQLRPDPYTAIVLMTHHFGRDFAYLDALLPLPIPYLGLLGPRKRREQMLVQLADIREGFDPGLLAKLHNPAGLDLGAETPEEIALSIVAEIRATIGGRTANPLRDCKGPIHAVPRPTVEGRPVVNG